MLVRPATHDDADAFAAVLSEVAEEGRWIGTEAPVDAEALHARVHGMLDDGGALFVLEDDGHIVGNLGLHRTRTKGVLSLGMAIVEGARGRGGGRALLEAAIEHARGTACHKIELEVWPDNERAIALYGRYGFKAEGLRRDHYRRRDGTLRSSLIMALLL